MVAIILVIFFSIKLICKFNLFFTFLIEDDDDIILSLNERGESYSRHTTPTCLGLRHSIKKSNELISSNNWLINNFAKENQADLSMQLKTVNYSLSFYSTRSAKSVLSSMCMPRKVQVAVQFTSKLQSGCVWSNWYTIYFKARLLSGTTLLLQPYWRNSVSRF